MKDKKFVVRASMLYDFKRGKTAADCHRTICAAFGEDSISISQCQRWFKRFANGNESLEDEERAGRPVVFDNEALIETSFILL